MSDVRVSITAASITVMSVLEVLRVSHVAAVSKDPILLVTEPEYWDRRSRMFEMVPFSVTLIELRRPELAEELAAMGCAQIIDPGGGISVVGDSLVVRSRAEAIGRFRTAVAALDPVELVTHAGGEPERDAGPR